MADVAAEAEAFLQSMQGEVEAQQAYAASQPAANPSAADLIAQAQAAAASFNAQLASQVPQQNGYSQMPATEYMPPPPDSNQQQEAGPTEGRRKRRNRWGNPAGAESMPAEAPEAVAPHPAPQAADGTPDATDGLVKKKRRSRWEQPEEQTQDLAIGGHIPKELTLPGGIRVYTLLLAHSHAQSFLYLPAVLVQRTLHPGSYLSQTAVLLVWLPCAGLREPLDCNLTLWTHALAGGSAFSPDRRCRA